MDERQMRAFIAREVRNLLVSFFTNAFRNTNNEPQRFAFYNFTNVTMMRTGAATAPRPAPQESRVVIEEVVDGGEELIIPSPDISPPAGGRDGAGSEAMPPPPMMAAPRDSRDAMPADLSALSDPSDASSLPASSKRDDGRSVLPQRQNIDRSAPPPQQTILQPLQQQRQQALLFPTGQNGFNSPQARPELNQSGGEQQQALQNTTPAVPFSSPGSKASSAPADSPHFYAFTKEGQMALIKQTKEAERNLQAKDFETRTRLVLESGRPLAPQIASAFKELTAMGSSLTYLQTHQEQLSYPPALLQLQETLEELQQQTLETMFSEPNTQEAAKEKPQTSFIQRQANLVNQLQNGLQGRISELQAKFGALTEELGLPMNNTPRPGLFEAEAIPEEASQLPQDEAEMHQTAKTSASPPRQSFPMLEEGTAAMKPGMPEARQTLEAEKSVLLQQMKDGRPVVFPESLRTAVRVRTQADLNAAVRAVQELSKTKSSNPIVMLPYPFERRASGAQNFNSRAQEGHKNKNGMIDIDDEEQPMVFVARGSVIVGDIFKEGRPEELPVQKIDLDHFLIGVVPVTNHQFAAWLNIRLKDRKAVIKDGMVYDQQNKLLAKTKESSLTSQIEIVAKNGVVYFSAMENCEDNPVVQVSWNGAHAFCEDNGVRLPTEAEWEKAAGMEDDKQKHRYGFGLSSIDATLSNYQTEINPRLENKTTPVGFYNGENQFYHKGDLVLTQNGASPYGCYDMSGNVREWVHDSAENRKLTKGGSYRTSAFELRVAAKTPLNPDETFDDVGFRVALSI
jgi:formylglycine-generating enzyme required for sulfatase activity